MVKRQRKKYEALLWSIALPGFGQFINKKHFKGFILMVAEVLINVMSNFNLAIMLSFNWRIQETIEIIDFQWLMFYPCLYMYGLWDAYRDENRGNLGPYSYVPLACCAYTVTVGLMYSTTFEIFGILFGPVFLPILSLIPGLIVGNLIRVFLTKRAEEKGLVTE
ncbi:MULTISPECIES: hypothetical protein [Bacillaceae]|uniref:Uncharacterized protein n=1 Tax=Evansella alkalicola TaxID=745819 RepID=A0ABS6K122_9BACI|nr:MULTISPECIES: hypothetical protein [Bacillaceae]MBU9724360.1 hypothetical protein [Bacillus alkalicola]